MKGYKFESKTQVCIPFFIQQLDAKQNTTPTTNSESSFYSFAKAAFQKYSLNKYKD